jgi:deoxyhypusine synthase
MEEVKHVKVEGGMSVDALVEELRGSGVLGAGRLVKAIDVITEMLQGNDYKVFMGLAGPMIPGGLRGIISNMVKNGYLDALVCSGANIVHDLLEALGYRHYRGSLSASDVKLKALKMGRIGDIYVKQKSFEGLEKFLSTAFSEVIPSDKSITISDLLSGLGSLLNDDESVLFQASRRGIPIFSPGLIDSMLSFNLLTFHQMRKVRLDLIGDFKKLVDLTFEARKIGTIILGGGLPKHHILMASILRGGVDAAVQITLDRPEAGSLSGARLEEAISWGKAKSPDKLVTVIGDAVMLFPIIISAVFSRVRIREGGKGGNHVEGKLI